MKHPIKFKQHFKNLNYYSMPDSILFAFRKRLHFVLYFLFTIALTILTVL